MADPFDAVHEAFAGQIDDDGGADQEENREEHRQAWARLEQADDDGSPARPVRCADAKGLAKLLEPRSPRRCRRVC
jgi:hypothetical protein